MNVIKKSEKLALLGGEPVRRRPFPFPPFPIIDKREIKAAAAALEEGSLSGFVGAPGPNFYGGPRVKAFEKAFAKKHGVKFALAVNSATAALHCAVAAAGVGFGDEVIVTPWSFTASAVAPLMVNAIPVFADVDERTYCLDPRSVEKNITKYTKAIIVVDLFGRPAPMTEILRLAGKHKLTVIEDAAQAPLASENGKLAGTRGDMGIFSFTASKQMTTSEGGMVITNDEKLAERVAMMRNHGEVLGEVKTRQELTGILGYNYRLGEIEAAIGLVQFKKLPGFLRRRRLAAAYLREKLSDIPFLEFPRQETGIEDSYFVYPVRFNQKKAGIHRDVFAKGLAAEGIPTTPGYVKPLYWNPVYQWKEFYGQSQFPFSAHRRKVDYPRGLCPVAEKLHQDVVLATTWSHPKLIIKDLSEIVKAVRKISLHLRELRDV